MKKLIALLVLLPTLAGAVTANSPVTPQTPQLAAVEIVSGVAQCTASGQPFSCCTGSGTGAGCTTTAASTDAAPTWVTVYTGGSAGSKVVALYLATTDGTATHVVTCSINKNGARAGGVALTTTTSKQGFGSAIPVLNLMSSTNWPGLAVDSDGNPFIYLSNANDKIDCRFATALTVGTLLGLTAVGADF